jgi:hypothetical protein
MAERFVIPIGIHGGGAEFAGQARDFFARIAVAHDQGATHGAKRRVDFLDGAQDELDAPVATRQRIEDGAVEDEHAVHPAVRIQGVVQGGVVLHAQVAAKPDEGNGHRRGNR